jgi:hypothetical protein
MNVQTLPLSELNRHAVAALVREVGVVGTLRFLSQYSRGAGNYTAERGALLYEAPMDELIEQARRIDEQENT